MDKILIADSHAIIRERLKQVFAETGDLVVTGEATSSDEVLDKALKDDYDALIVELEMQGGGVLDILKELKARKPELPVLVLSFCSEEQCAEKVLKAGASAYRAKESLPNELVATVRYISQAAHR